MANEPFRCETPGYVPDDPCGTPHVILAEIVIAAATQANLLIPIQTGARFRIRKIVVMLDRQPLVAVAMCLVDLVRLDITNEEYGTKESLITGTGNLLTAFGGNGCIEGDFFSRTAQIRQGTEVDITLNNNDAINVHRVSFGIHGYYAETLEAMRRKGTA